LEKWSKTTKTAKKLGHTSRPLLVYQVYSPLHQSVFSPASKLIHPCIKVYSPLHQSLFSPPLKFIHPCIKFHSPLHQSSFTPKCTQNGTKRPGSGQDVWPNVLACKKVPYQINRSILVGEMVRNNHKIVFYAILGAF
jgi:hypothetical protein